MMFVYEGSHKRPGVAVVLDGTEMALVTEVARERQNEALRMNLPDRHGYEGDGLKAHIQGAAGEYAVAASLRRQWSATVNTFKRGGDVGDIQVRTRTSHAWDLILRPDDRPSDVFYLVTGVPPRLRVVGSIVAREGMTDRNIQTYGGRPPAWFVPQTDLVEFQLKGQCNARPL